MEQDKVGQTEAARCEQMSNRKIERNGKKGKNGEIQQRRRDDTRRIGPPQCHACKNNYCAKDSDGCTSRSRCNQSLITYSPPEHGSGCQQRQTAERYEWREIHHRHAKRSRLVKQQTKWEECRKSHGAKHCKNSRYFALIDLAIGQHNAQRQAHRQDVERHRKRTEEKQKQRTDIWSREVPNKQLTHRRPKNPCRQEVRAA